MTKNYRYLVLLTMLPMLSGCSAIETIFKAGMWWAFFLIFIVIVGIIWLVSRMRK